MVFFLPSVQKCLGHRGVRLKGESRYLFLKFGWNSDTTSGGILGLKKLSQLERMIHSCQKSESLLGAGNGLLKSGTYNRRQGLQWLSREACKDQVQVPWQWELSNKNVHQTFVCYSVFWTGLSQTWASKRLPPASVINQTWQHVSPRANLYLRSVSDHLLTLHEQSGVSFSPEGSLRSKARLDSDAFHCLSLVTSSGVGTSCLSEVKSTEALSLFLDLLMQNLRHLTHPNLLLFIWGGKRQIVLINRKCVCVLFQVASKTFRKVQLGDGTQLSRRTFCSGMDLPGQEKWYRSGKSMGPLKGKISLFLGGHVKEPRELQYYSSH